MAGVCRRIVLASCRRSNGSDGSHRRRRTDMRAAVQVFAARRYASSVYAVVVCPSVRLSVTSRCCIETTGRIELVFGMDASFHLSDTVL